MNEKLDDVGLRLAPIVAEHCQFYNLWKELCYESRGWSNYKDGMPSFVHKKSSIGKQKLLWKDLANNYVEELLKFRAIDFEKGEGK